MMDDLISRQAAIDAIEYELEMINSALDSRTLDFNARERLYQRRGEAKEILSSIQRLPSIQSKIAKEISKDAADVMESVVKVDRALAEILESEEGKRWLTTSTPSERLR